MIRTKFTDTPFSIQCEKRTLHTSKNTDL